MNNKLNNNETGFTFIEMIVSVTLFVLVMLAATQIFQIVVDGQRSALASQNLQENMRYALEMMSKEIRMAQRSDTSCGGTTNNKVYNEIEDQDFDEFYFKNKDGECVKYYVDNNRLKIIRDDGTVKTAFVTPDEIKITGLEFYILDNNISTQNQFQPNVTILIKVEARKSGTMHKQAMTIQTTISSRYYE